MTRPTVLALSGAVVLLVAASATAWSGPLGPQSSSTNAEPSPEADRPAKTAQVTRRTLETREELDGTLGYEGDVEVSGLLPGTLTWLPDEGDVLERGDLLYEVDGKNAAILMYGDRPAWRTLDRRSKDGADIEQLEENLSALGYASKSMKVDDEWDERTTAAVKKWQKAAGLKVDGVIDLGEVVFLDGPMRVSEHSASLGSHVSGNALLGGTTPTPVVTVALDAEDRNSIHENLAVEIELPDGSTTTGRVSSIGRVAHEGESSIPGESASATIDVTIKLDNPQDAADLDQAPVTVDVVTSSRPDVLTVPVSSLLALLEGGYAVEVVDAGGGHSYVTVELGRFQDGWVEITSGALQEGQEVVIP
jgi:multidrug efflux pump subunit AcrA (membrane-fusion protein)